MPNQRQEGRGCAETRSSIGEWRGGAFAGALLLMAAGVCEALPKDASYRLVSSETLVKCLPGIVLLALTVATYTRWKRAALALWFAVSLVGLVVQASQSTWGGGMLDGTELMRRHYYAYSYLSDVLYALGFAMLLISCAALCVLESGILVRANGR